MNMIGIAKYYIKQGFNVIPINPATKKPTCKWKAYQSNMLNDSQIYSLFISAKGIAIVTGKLSGVFVIDVDSPDNAIDNYISDSLETPTVSTPSHLHHLYFQYPANQEVRNNQEIQVIKGCDVRGEGGYAIVPPTPGYTFLTSFRDCKVAEAPDKLLQVLNKNVTERYKGVTGSDRKQPNVTERDKNKVSTDVHECPQVSINLEKGHRDSTLYHMAAILKRGGASRSEALQVIEILAKNCKPPFPHQEVEEKIKSVYDSGLPRENSLSQEISEWISITKGDFSITECDKDLLISTKRDKINRRQIFHRLVESGEIERVGNKNGIFRRIEKDENIVDWKNADISKTISVAMPFDIDDYVKLYPKNIVMIAGSSNAGKTAFLFNIARYNMHKHKIVYFTSEMGAEEVKIRLSGFDCNYEDWNFPIIDRSSNFADVIRPDCINIIDFLEITDNFYAIGGEIKKIFDKLGSGLAFIALQKKKGCELGRGAEFSMEKSRLYLSIDSGELKIVKAKNWAKPEYNPNGMKFKFKLVNGCKFIKN